MHAFNDTNPALFGNGIIRMHDTVEVHYCVFTMQGKLMSFERSTDFSGIQDLSIRRSSSVVIQNLGKRDIK